MKIQVEPRNLQTLEVICEILYKLHPTVLNNLLDLEKTLGPVLGFHFNKDDLNSEQRDILERTFEHRFLTNESEENESEENEQESEEANNMEFDELIKYIKLDTDEYIPIKFYVEVEDHPSVGKKVKKLIEILERSKGQGEFSNMRREEDCHAYFGESYTSEKLSRKKQRKRDKLFLIKDVDELKKLLIKEKLYEI